MDFGGHHCILTQGRVNTSNQGRMLCRFIFPLYIFYLIMEVKKLFFKKCYYRKNIRETWSWESKEKA